MKKLNIRNLLIGLVIVIVLAVVLLRGDQLVELVETIKKGAVIPLIAAVCTQLGKYFAQSFSYSYAFEAVDEHMNPRETLPLVFGTFFVNTIAPSLNLAGTTLVVDDARRRGIAPGKATSAALLMQITVDSGFATIMLIAFGILAATVGLSPLWFLLGLLVIALVSAMVLILVLGRKRPALVLRALRPIERLVDRVLVRFKSSASWARFPTLPALSRITPRQRRRRSAAPLRPALASWPASAWWAWRSACISPNLSSAAT